MVTVSTTVCGPFLDDKAQLMSLTGWPGRSGRLCFDPGLKISGFIIPAFDILDAFSHADIASVSIGER